MNFCIDSFEYEILTILKEIGCCFKCSLRFCGINFLQSNIHPKTFLAKTKYFDEHEALVDTDPCIICLGILQNNALITFVNKMLKQVDKENYDCNTISFTLTIPISIQIRERAVCIYLSKIDRLLKYSNNKIKVQTIKDVWKWFLSSEIEYSIKKRMENFNFISPLTVDVLMSYSEDQAECMEFSTNYINLSTNYHFMKKKKEKCITKKAIEIIINSITNEQFEKCFTVPPKIPVNYISIDKFICKHNSIFIGARYTKQSRLLCQTPWLVHGKLKMENSVQDLVSASIIDYTKAESIKFLSSGREDVDVRMLFYGRPFAIEIVNPKVTNISQDHLLFLKKKINKSTKKIQISSDLKIVTKNDLKKLKEGEYSKSKTYRALCICKKIVDNSYLLKKLKTVTNLKIIQNTPIRVLHRRTLSPRERIIYELRIRFPNLQELEIYQTNKKYISDEYKFIIFDFKAQAGTYVKEFVHGDFGRTMPNLCYLLETEIDIIALDVTNISLEWP